jgi:hypothetical protein
MTWKDDKRFLQYNKHCVDARRLAGVKDPPMEIYCNVHVHTYLINKKTN